MKKYTFYTFIALFFVAVVGCKDYLDINTNPNAPSVTVPDLVLSGALTESARIISQDMGGYAAYWAGYWSRSGTYSQSGAVNQNFGLTNNSFQNVWLSSYLNASNYNFVENNSKAIAGYDYYVAIAKIMKVYDFHNLIDNYGNIPFKSALQGFQSLSPKYDSATITYESLSAELDDAVAIISTQSSIIPPTAKPIAATTDVMFKGNMAMWAKLANTLNLRLLLRQSQLPSKAAFIAAEIGKIKTNGKGFLGVGEDAIINPGYAQATGLQNPLWEQNALGVGGDIGNRDVNRTSAYSLAFFKTNNDPRVDRLFLNVGDVPGHSNGTNYKGIPFGAPPDAQIATALTSAFGLGVMGSPAAPVIFLSAAQSLFLQAEASWHAGKDPAVWGAGLFAPADMPTLFNNGITESFRVLGVPDYAAAASTYYGQALPDVNFSAAGAGAPQLHAIIKQKWAANCSIDCMEAWCDIRRLNIPDITSGTDLPYSLDAAKISNTPPIRLLYPQTEYSNNASAVAGEGSINQFTSKIFWQFP